MGFLCCGGDDDDENAMKMPVQDRGNQHNEIAPKLPQFVKPPPIEVPAIRADELNEVTNNFRTDCLIGEGSFGRVYHGLLRHGQQAAIKKLDASKQPNEEFLAEICNEKTIDKTNGQWLTKHKKFKAWS